MKGWAFMIVLVEWKRFSIALMIVIGCVITFFLFIGFLIANFPTGYLSCVITIVFTALVVNKYQKRTNGKIPSPVSAESGTLHCYDGKKTLETSCSDLYYAVGENERYVANRRYDPHWVELDYGKLEICYNDNGERKKFIIRNVKDASEAAVGINKYAKVYQKSVN